MKPSYLIICCLLMFVAHTGNADDDFPGIENLMTAAQFSAAGLDGLTAEQLAELNHWLTSYTANEAPQIAKISKSVKKAATATIASHIDGEFRGWTGDTVFRLKNGQVWRQRIGGRYWYKAKDPAVQISKNMLGFYQLKVMATGRSVGVSRVR